MGQEFMLGGAAAISATCVTHPLDVLKVRMLLHGELQRSMYPRLALAQELYAEHGVRAFYRGLSAAIFRQSLFSTTRFGLVDSLKPKFEKNMFGTLASTLTAGGVAAFVSCPADVALVRMQSGKWPAYKNAFHALRCMRLNEGFLAWYKGLGALIVRGMLVTSGQFIAHDALVKELSPVLPGYVVSPVSGMGAALAATTLSAPADVVKSRYMNSLKYNSSLDCLTKTYRVEGMRGLYKGFVPALARSAPQVTLMWMFYDQYSQFIKS
jgi:hypothetical protein